MPRFFCHAPPQSLPASHVTQGRRIQPPTPSNWTFWLSVILVVLAIIVGFAHIHGVEPQYAPWIGLLGYIVLVIGRIFKTTSEPKEAAKVIAAA
jgi:hypothetical protein